MTNLAEALKWKYPDATITTHDSVISDWTHPSVKKPDAKEVKAILIEYSNYQNSILYKKKRAEEYPAIGDQLDQLWKAVAALSQNTQTMLPQEAAKIMDEIEVVKGRHPKP